MVTSPRPPSKLPLARDSSSQGVTDSQGTTLSVSSLAAVPPTGSFADSYNKRYSRPPVSYPVPDSPLFVYIVQPRAIINRFCPWTEDPDEEYQSARVHISAIDSPTGAARCRARILVGYFGRVSSRPGGRSRFRIGAGLVYRPQHGRPLFHAASVPVLQRSRTRRTTPRFATAICGHSA